MLAVEAAMVWYSKRFGEDEVLWGTVGLLHDFDYEQFPDLTEHTVAGANILRDRGYPIEVIQAIQSHNPANELNIPRDTQLAKALFACDELCGFVTAVALIRPSKSIHDLPVKSVKKRFKEKNFAAKVSREDIFTGTEELAIPMDEHIANVIEAMRGVAVEIGLEGQR